MHGLQHPFSTTISGTKSKSFFKLEVYHCVHKKVTSFCCSLENITVLPHKRALYRLELAQKTFKQVQKMHNIGRGNNIIPQTTRKLGRKKGLRDNKDLQFKRKESTTPKLILKENKLKRHTVAALATISGSSVNCPFVIKLHTSMASPVKNVCC